MFLKLRLLLTVFNGITLSEKESFKAWHFSPLNYLGFREWSESFWLKSEYCTLEWMSVSGKSLESSMTVI